MKAIDDIKFKQIIKKGEVSSVYLVNYTDQEGEYICKIYEREKVDGTTFMKYLKNHLIFLQTLKHKNIIKFVDIKKTKSHCYIIYEYCNGGNLLSLLEKYSKIYNHPFSQEVIQHLMKQIIEAFKYIHKSEVIHGNINLENILIHFENEEDRENLNMMKAIVKIDDFGYSYIKKKSDIKNNVVCFDMYRNLIIKKASNKEEIYNIGLICYMMTFGNFAKKCDDMEELINQIEKENISPVPVSRELLSFLKDMLRNYSYKRLTCEQLLEHEFLQKNAKHFKLIEPSNNFDYFEENEENKNLCVNCFKNSSEIILSPCGHKCICHHCCKKLKLKLKGSNKFKSCPICRKPIISVVEKI